MGPSFKLRQLVLKKDAVLANDFQGFRMESCKLANVQKSNEKQANNAR